MYRFYQDLANAHIAELEREARDARLARRRGARVKSELSNVTVPAPQLLPRLRRIFDSHRFGFRTPAGLSLVPQRCEFNPVVDHSNRECEVIAS